MEFSRRGFFRTAGHLHLLLPLLCCIHQSAQAEQSLFRNSDMTLVQMNGLRLRLGKPVQVTESHGYAYVPTLARFPGGALLVTYSLVPDTNENPSNVGAFQISRDGGRTWGHRYEVLPEHHPLIYVPQEDGSLVAIPSHLFPVSPGDRHNFRAAYLRFEPGARRMILEPDGVRVVDWPWPVNVVPRPVPKSNWYVRMAFDGIALKLEDRWLATAYSRRGDEPMQLNVVLVSRDQGRTWRYLSTIADAAILPTPPRKWAGGPSETALVRLADGELMAVFRVGNGRDWNLRRAYSKDGGTTWSQADVIPAYSVAPSMVRTRGGTIVLSTGRPGISLWFSTDGRGRRWQEVDVVKHHNLHVPDETYRILPYPFENPREMNTWSYTELVEVAPNRLLLVYDRVPPDPRIVAYGTDPRSTAAERLSWRPSPDSGERFRIFLLPIEVEGN